MAKISVVMPIYKVEKYLAKAIESVLNQTHKDIEVFLIDDGSPDNSGTICDDYAKRDNRIIVIHKQNEGAPAARNIAIEKSNGKYIYFIDSDDWIESTMLEEMYNLAENNTADLVVTGFCMEYYEKGKYVQYQNKIKDRVYSSQQEFRKEAYKYLNNSILSLPWNKLYLSKTIKEHKIRFPNKKWDDHHFNMEYLKYVNKVVMSDITMYHWYRSREGSETMINYQDPNMFEIRKEHYNHVLELYDYWRLNDLESEDAINSYYVGRLFQCIQEISDNKSFKYKQKRDKIKTILEDSQTKKALKQCKKLSNKLKVLVFPMKINNVTMCLIFGKTVSFIRKCFPELFIKLKEREVHSA